MKERPHEGGRHVGVVVIGGLLSRFGRPGRASATYVPQLDGLRCLAVTFVLVWHATLRGSRVIDRLAPGTDAQAWVPHGEIGVALFFVISGYVIAAGLMRHRTAGRFYIRRLWRIAPPYVLSLTGFFVVLRIAHYQPQDVPLLAGLEHTTTGLARSYALSLVYLHGIVLDAASRINPPIWSLETEMQFYALAPLLAWLWWRTAERNRVWLGLLLIAVALLADSIAYAFHPFDGRYRWSLLANAPLFLAGFALAELRPFARCPPGWADAALLGGIAGLLTVGWWWTATDTHTPPGLAHALCDVLLLGSAVAVVAGALHGRIGARLFGAPYVSGAGATCYSVYLIQVPLTQFLADHVLRPFGAMSPALLYLLSLVLLIPACLVVGLVFFALIERPFMRPPSWPRRAAAQVLP